MINPYIRYIFAAFCCMFCGVRGATGPDTPSAYVVVDIEGPPGGSAGEEETPLLARRSTSAVTPVRELGALKLFARPKGLLFTVIQFFQSMLTTKVCVQRFLFAMARGVSCPKKICVRVFAIWELPLRLCIAL